MIKIKPFRQSKGYCGPACLKMALSVYEINKSERYLAKATKTSRKFGCKEKEIINFTKKIGFKSYVKEKSSIKELKQLANKEIPAIVAQFSPEEASHYSVVAGFKGNNIYLADPHFGKIKKHKVKWFNERWFDVQKDKLYLREMIVIRK